MSIERLHYSGNDIHPEMRTPINQLAEACRTAIFRHEGSDYMLQPFEGFRLPSRQEYLLTIMKTTKARPWQSAHQYGLAVDFACRSVDQHGRLAGWFWPQNEAIWNFLKMKARAIEPLDVPISWDHGHVEHHMWKRIKITLK